MAFYSLRFLQKPFKLDLNKCKFFLTIFWKSCSKGYRNVEINLTVLCDISFCTIIYLIEVAFMCLLNFFARANTLVFSYCKWSVNCTLNTNRKIGWHTRSEVLVSRLEFRVASWKCSLNFFRSFLLPLFQLLLMSFVFPLICHFKWLMHKFLKHHSHQPDL